MGLLIDLEYLSQVVSCGFFAVNRALCYFIYLILCLHFTQNAFVNVLWLLNYLKIVSMKTLEKNMRNLFGSKGSSWLSALPTITDELSVHWGLSDLQPVSNMTWNFVAKALKDGNVPVALKISCDEKLIADEIRALQHFDGHGAVRLIDYNHEHLALLLSQMVPGDSLQSLYPKYAEDVMDHYAQVVRKLCSVPQPSHAGYRHIRHWLTAIDRVEGIGIPLPLLERAIALKNRLLDTSGQEFLLHGDLHHDNILNNANEWLAIDPKGILGEREFEVAAFDFIYKTELEIKQDIPTLFHTRVGKLSEKLDLDPQRLSDWAFVRLILGAAWMIEDNGDPRCFLALAKRIYAG